MLAPDRLKNEQAFHDRQARERSVQFQQSESLVFADDSYLDHEAWVRPAFQQLGDVRDKPVLDFGCGHGMAAVVLARRGACVTAFDLSHGYLDEARSRARANGVSIDFVKADGERLPFANHSFQAIWGCAILHHLDVEKAGPELARVLRPGGVAVFCEPWGENPLLNWARNNLPYPGKNRTADEKPLRKSQVDFLRTLFPRVDLHGYQLLSMARPVLGRFCSGLDWCDRQLLGRIPRLHHWCRYVVLTLQGRMQ
jgi:ubiquinone/menaquinone biosynthesis C-methylase UbiE